MELVVGLGNVELVAVSGALVAVGVFFAEFEIGLRPFAVGILIGCRAGFLELLAGSGRVMSSIICSMSASANKACSFRLDAEWGSPEPLLA